MGQAMFRVNGDFLMQLLNLPEDTKLLRIREHRPVTYYIPGGEAGEKVFYPPDAELLVEHPCLPERKEGEEAVMASPHFRAVCQTAAEFKDWGLPNEGGGSEASEKQG
jgi:hypothetical protein